MAREMKQRYHLEADRGLLNDPNGLAYFHGKYYIFFNGIALKRTILIKNGEALYQRI